jgi:hypothetical protein
VTSALGSTRRLIDTEQFLARRTLLLCALLAVLVFLVIGALA